MDGCLLCTEVAPGTGPKDLAMHIEKRHCVETRDDEGFTAKLWRVEGREFQIIEKLGPERNYYRCSSCVIEVSNIATMTDHIKQKHLLSWQEKKDLRLMVRQDKADQRTYCKYCWIIFSNAEELEQHKRSREHRKKEKYVEGSGCDVCRKVLPPVYNALDHSRTETHIRKMRYKGNGCDICRLSKSELVRLYYYRFNEDASLRDVLEYHNACSEDKHQHLLMYEPGSGCDLCLLYEKPHDETSKHLKRCSHQKNIYDRFIAPTIRQKSARNVIPLPNI